MSLQAGGFQSIALVTVIVCVGLLVLVLMLSRRQAMMRGAQSGSISAPGDRNEQELGLSLDGVALSPIDRVFPRQPGQFLMLVAGVSLGAWIAGYLLAPDKQRFLTSPEWWFQPFYIAAHLIALRLFINVFTRNYAAGTSRLDMSRRQALRWIRPILGINGAVAAALVALPFCYFDFFYLFSARYTPMGGDKVVRAIDYLMWVIWTLEWFINAFIWVLLIGFMVKNCTTLTRFPFRAPIHTVLRDKLYRPFLQMSAQGSTVVLGFSFVTVLYLYYTGGELTDYLGLGVTIALLLVCFIPPWLVLRGKVEKAVRHETTILQEQAGLGSAIGASENGAGSAGVAAARPLDARVDEALALLKIWHLHNLYGNLGQTEAKAIVVRLMAPAATIGWQASNNFGEIVHRATAYLAVLLGK